HTCAPNVSGNEPRTRKPIVYASLTAAVLLLLVGVAGAWRWYRAQGEASQIRSIAVLPLEDVAGDPSQAYFSAGITDALISTLSQIRELKVISRATAMRYKGSQKRIHEIGRALGEDAVVAG